MAFCPHQPLGEGAVSLPPTDIHTYVTHADTEGPFSLFLPIAFPKAEEEALGWMELLADPGLNLRHLHLRARLGL